MPVRVVRADGAAAADHPASPDAEAEGREGRAHDRDVPALSQAGSRDFRERGPVRSYASVEALRRAPQLAAFLKWIRKQKPDRVFATRLSGEHPGSKRERLCIRRRQRV